MEGSWDKWRFSKYIAGKTRKEKQMIDKKLQKLSKSNIYPFHMPGHKRQSLDLGDPYSIDITEIDGFDNLHSPEGIIRDAQERAAQLYGAKKSYFLVNGSTCGLLAAISAAVPKGKKILVARNCHKAVYHSIFLRELVPIYMYPTILEEGIQGAITLETVREKLENNPEVSAVIITSPTYDGVVSDVRAIAELVHSYGAKLIVDQAHGAHFGFEERLPESATVQGADAVIVSLHKTLPCFTQTALLNICGDLFDTKRVEKFLAVYETSSPSYVFLAGIDKCIRYISEEKNNIFPKYFNYLEEFYGKLEGLEKLKVISSRPDIDSTKILVFTDGCSIDGPKLYNILLEKYEIQLEMCASNYILALSSVMDTREGLNRLANALLEIDSEIKYDMQQGGKAPIQLNCGKIYTEMERALEIHQADELPINEVEPEQAANQISGDYIFLYPPGIPIVVPGEIITEELIETFRQIQGQGLKLHGLTEEGLIKIVNPS